MKGRSSEAHEVELRVGDDYEIRLPGRGGAGYTWQCAFGEGERDAVAVSLAYAPPAQAPQPGALPPPTMNVDTIAGVRALQPGTVRVVLRNVRSWEKGVPPLEERILDVTVTERDAPRTRRVAPGA